MSPPWRYPTYVNVFLFLHPADDVASLLIRPKKVSLTQSAPTKLLQCAP